MMCKFADIKRIARAGYSVHVGWCSISEWISDNREIMEVSLRPDFQRGYVWTEEQKVSYLEYVLKDGTSGKDIYWNCPGWMFSFEGPMELIDGQQRIGAVLFFLDGKTKVFGHYYHEYEDKLDLLKSRFNFHVHSLTSRAEVVRWYLDLNSGGTYHTQDDIENAKRVLKEIIDNDI